MPRACLGKQLRRAFRIRKNEQKTIFAPFLLKTDHFTKTGSGQTQKKLRKRTVRFFLSLFRAQPNLKRLPVGRGTRTAPR
jgi:hypothetical protein